MAASILLRRALAVGLLTAATTLVSGCGREAPAPANPGGAPGGPPAATAPASLVFPFPPDPRETQYISDVRQITSEGEKSGESYFGPPTPIGRMIIYQSVRDDCPWYQIYITNIDQPGYPTLRVSTGQGKTTCAFFHPTLNRVIWASTHLDESTWAEPDPAAGGGRYRWDKDSAFDIFQSDPEGKNVKRLTDTPGYDAEASYSPDGSQIVYTSQQSGDLEIWVMDADGSNPRQITHRPGWDGGPFFSPDGKEIVYRTMGSEERFACQVRVVGVDGSNDRALTDDETFNWAPYWHPDGKRIVYVHVIPGPAHNFELFLMNRDGSGKTRLTFSAGADVLPSFSGDGKLITWTSTRMDGTSQVFVARFQAPETLQGDPQEVLDMPAPGEKEHSERFGSAHGSSHGGGSGRGGGQGEGGGDHGEGGDPQDRDD